MDGKKWILLLILLLWGYRGFGQSYQYTYTDPCTGIPNTVTITQPSGSVTLFYAGQWNTFTQAQLQSGGYEAWVASINATFPPGSNPCAGAGAQTSTSSNTSTATQTANNVSSIVGIAASLGSQASSATVTPPTPPSGGSSSSNDNSSSTSSGSSSGSSTSTGGSTSSGGGSTSTGGSSSGSSGGSTSGGGSTGGSSGSGSGGSTGGSGGSGGGNTGGSSGGGSGDSGGGNTGGSSGGGTGSGGSGEPSGGVSSGEGGSVSSGGTSDGGGGTETGATGGNDNTTTASGGDSEGGDDGGGGSGGGGKKRKSKQEKVGRGALIGAGDFVIIRNGNDYKAQGMDNFRFNASLTHVNTKQNFIKGINFNFTTGENVLNSTLYGSYKKDNFMGVFSNSTMTNFKTDIFNTTTLLASQKLWIVTPMLGTNFTLGKIGESDFQNWSIVAGGFTNFNNDWFLNGNVMLLGIYSPYIFYYEGQWYKSGLLFVPLANIDFKITETFKWSISFGGAYQYNADILNFQLSTGTKILL